jgi:uncharacterized protein YjgD (DUF1641 family)
MTVDSPALLSDVPTGRDPLAAMLADPEIRASLSVIAANAPTLAALTTVANGLLERSPVITSNINQLVAQLRASSDSGIDGASLVKDAQSLASLGRTVGGHTDAISEVLNSPILSPEVVDVIGRLGMAAKKADDLTRGKKAPQRSVFALLRELKDPGVQETLDFLLTFAKAFGEEDGAK